MDSNAAIRTVEKTFTMTSTDAQTLCIAHTLVEDGGSCLLDVYVTGEDAGGSSNKLACASGQFLCFRSNGVISASAEMPAQLIDNGGSLSGAHIEVDGDDILVVVDFDNWTSGTQHATIRAMIKSDTLAP